MLFRSSGAWGIYAFESGKAIISDRSTGTYVCTILPSVGVQESEQKVYSQISLFQNFPNPFNPITVIKYSIPQRSIINLKIYDVLGKEVVSLIRNDLQERGNHEITFDANNVSSGIFFYQLNVNNGEIIQTKKLIITK